MTIMEIILAAATLLSFALAVYSILSTEIKKANERANIEILRERLKGLYQGLKGIHYTADAIVQVPKERSNIEVVELQNLGRVLRNNALELMERIRKSREQLDKWKFGNSVFGEKFDMKPEDISKLGYSDEPENSQK